MGQMREAEEKKRMAQKERMRREEGTKKMAGRGGQEATEVRGRSTTIQQNKSFSWRLRETHVGSWRCPNVQPFGAKRFRARVFLKFRQNLSIYQKKCVFGNIYVR